MQLLLQWKSNNSYIVCVRVCSLCYPACNAHAQYSHLWPVRLCRIFVLSHTLQDFRGEKMIEHKMCVLIFSTNLSET
jgi:hypothetical protein